MMKFFFYLHLGGLLLLIAGLVLFWMPQADNEGTSHMLMVASAIGLGLMMISPYPVVKAVQWMMKKDQS